MAPQHDATERTLHAAVGVDPTVVAGSPPSLEDPAADGAPLERGRLLGRYILLDRLGSGGMGAVYVAYDPELDRKVAIKVMHAGPGVDASADKRARLLREAQAMARLTHPNVVAIYDVGTFEDQVFIAMELIDGETLGDWLKRARPSWPEVVQIFIAAGRGLEAAHQADIVHRDFKPDNVLIGADGRVRVLDFGLARQIANAEPLTAPPRRVAAPPQGLSLDHPTQDLLHSQVTRYGAVIGTPAYMSPEQHLGAPADARSDQYSFCVALYEALYGQRPFDEETYLALIAAVTRGAPRPPPRAHAVPSGLAAIVLRGLETDPARRHPTMSALLAELSRDPQARRRRSLALAGALGLAALLAGGLWQRDRVHEQRCRTERQSFADAWTPEIAAALEAAFLATEIPHAAATWSRVGPALAAYNDKIADAAHTSCVATVIEREQEEPAHQRQLACLSRQRARLQGVTELLRHAQPDDLLAAIQATYQLPPPALCRDPEVLTGPADPHDPAHFAGEAALHRDLDRAHALALTGRTAAALEAARALGERALALDDPSITAELALLHAITAETIDRHESRDAAHRGLIAAIQSGHDRLAAELAVHTAALESWSEGQHEAGHRALDQAAAWLRRGGGDPRVEALLLRTRARIFSIERRFDDARRALNSARELVDRHHLGPILRADLLRLLASVEWTAGQQAPARELWAQTLRLDLEIFGEDHPNVAQDLNNMGVQEIQRGAPEAAAPLLERSLQIRRRALGDRSYLVGESLINLGLLASARGDHQLALTHLLAAHERLREHFPPGHERVIMVESNIGAILIELARGDEAAPYLESALLAAGDEAAQGLAPRTNLAHLAFTRARLAACRGDLEVAAQQRTIAAQHLARALADGERLFAGDHPFFAEVLILAARLAHLSGQLPEARAYLDRALTLASAKLGDDTMHTAQIHIVDAELHLLSGDRSAAIAAAERGLALGAAAERPELGAELRFVLARALWSARGERPRARQLAEAARDFFRGPTSPLPCHEVEAWLAAPPR
jgi:tetratricopeptide (TPR) repeat protein/predicted Ser/Thr protein kinase